MRFVFTSPTIPTLPDNCHFIPGEFISPWFLSNQCCRQSAPESVWNCAFHNPVMAESPADFCSNSSSPCEPWAAAKPQGDSSRNRLCLTPIIQPACNEPSFWEQSKLNVCRADNVSNQTGQFGQCVSDTDNLEVDPFFFCQNCLMTCVQACFCDKFQVPCTLPTIAASFSLKFEVPLSFPLLPPAAIR